jgi:hypothetical protein
MSSKNQSIALELDRPTVQILDVLATQWGVSREDAAKRAIAEAAPPESEVHSDDAARMHAFRELQRRLNLTPEKAAAWKATIRDARS